MSQYTQQDSQAGSEFYCSQSEEDEDFQDAYYYGEEDEDAISPGRGEEGATDASFQEDPEAFDYVCLTTEEVWNYLDTQVRELSKDIQVDLPASRAMLYTLNWEMDEVKRRYKEDARAMLIKAHLKPDHSPVAEMAEECPICLCSMSDDNKLGMACGHVFCTNCWSEYVKEKIETGHSTRIECMNCSLWLGLEQVLSLTHSLPPHLSSVYRLHALSEYVVSHPLLRWCQGSDCQIVVCAKKKRAAKQSVCSQCKTSFCFMCGDQYHCPADCKTIKDWFSKLHDHSESYNYIISNTKECPKCQVSIEKSGGCNHMQCTQCRHNFCWKCMEAWQAHTNYYNCARYSEEDVSNSTKAMAARNALRRYLFYYERWMTHDQSLRLEEETKKTLLAQMEEMTSQGKKTWIDFQYLLDALALLKQCRYTLKFTYPCAYYMSDDRKTLFEYQQAQLELEVENLSWKVERADQTEVADMRQQMTVAEIKRKTLLREFIPI